LTQEQVSLKFKLKWLHEEIDLYDRKIAHLERNSASSLGTTSRSKLETKRGTLEKAARKLAAEGVEFDPQSLPRSFRAAETPAEIPATA